MWLDDKDFGMNAEESAWFTESNWLVASQHHDRYRLVLTPFSIACRGNPAAPISS
jgi:hypothetical protein